MGIVHRSQGRLDPASKDLRSEPWIVAEIAARSLDDESIDWRGLAQNYDEIRDLIEASIPGFDAYNERVRSPNGFELPNPPRDKAKFNTPSGLAEFTLHELPDLVPQHGGTHIMMTLRSHDQYNTTIYGLEDRYRGVKGNRRVVFMNAEEMAERGWKTGHRVDLIGHWKVKSAVQTAGCWCHTPSQRETWPATSQRPMCSFRWTPPRPCRTHRPASGLKSVLLRMPRHHPKRNEAITRQDIARAGMPVGRTTVAGPTRRGPTGGCSRLLPTR